MTSALWNLLSKGSLIRVRCYSCCVNIDDVYILSGSRTPIGTFQGKLSPLTGVQLTSKALTSAVESACIEKHDIQEIVLGSVFQAGLGQCPAHQTALFSGLSKSICSFALSKACGSGMKAVMLGCQLIATQSQEVVAAGGLESTTHTPYILRRKALRWGDLRLLDLLLHDAIIDPYDYIDVTHFAEETVKEYQITRKDQDDYTICSFERAMKAQSDNVFAAEITPVVIKTKKGEETVCEDEQVKRFHPEKLRSLPPQLGPEGTITAANASGFNDGACMLILASGNFVLRRGLKPLAKVISYCDINTDPRKFVTAPAICIPKVLVRANLKKCHINRWEINETFAVTTLANVKTLKLDLSNVNVYGGALSLGHPFGMTGARLIVHLAHTLMPGEFGCACISYVSGGASAVIIQKME